MKKSHGERFKATSLSSSIGCPFSTSHQDCSIVKDLRPIVNSESPAIHILGKGINYDSQLAVQSSDKNRHCTYSEWMIGVPSSIVPMNQFRDGSSEFELKIPGDVWVINFLVRVLYPIDHWYQLA